MKKLITKILILITLVTFIIPKFSFATETPNSETDEDRYNKYKNLTEEGVANVNGRLEKLRDTNTGSDFIATVLSLVSSGIAEAARAVLTLCVNEGDTTHETRITIAGMISGEYPILNNDFLLNQNGNSESGTIRKSASNEAIKEQVARVVLWNKNFSNNNKLICANIHWNKNGNINISR